MSVADDTGGAYRLAPTLPVSLATAAETLLAVI